MPRISDVSREAIAVPAASSAAVILQLLILQINQSDRSKIEEIVKISNSQHLRLKFTLHVIYNSFSFFQMFQVCSTSKLGMSYIN
jgi:hypothetical protein